MKAIRSRSDLAINDVPPAFAQPLQMGRPDIGSPDAFAYLNLQTLNTDSPTQKHGGGLGDLLKPCLT